MRPEPRRTAMSRFNVAPFGPDPGAAARAAFALTPPPPGD
jgi:hypothetical protein